MFKYIFKIWYRDNKSTFVVTHADGINEALNKIRKNFDVTDYFLLEEKLLGEDFLLKRYS